MFATLRICEWCSLRKMVNQKGHIFIEMHPLWFYSWTKYIRSQRAGFFPEKVQCNSCSQPKNWWIHVIPKRWKGWRELELTVPIHLLSCTVVNSVVLIVTFEATVVKLFRRKGMVGLIYQSWVSDMDQPILRCVDKFASGLEWKQLKCGDTGHPEVPREKFGMCCRCHV